LGDTRVTQLPSNKFRYLVDQIFLGDTSDTRVTQVIHKKHYETNYMTQVTHFSTYNANECLCVEVEKRGKMIGTEREPYRKIGGKVRHLRHLRRPLIDRLRQNRKNGPVTRPLDEQPIPLDFQKRIREAVTNFLNTYGDHLAQRGWDHAAIFGGADPFTTDYEKLPGLAALLTDRVQLVSVETEKLIFKNNGRMLIWMKAGYWVGYLPEEEANRCH
jgi:hypothetical protein